MTSQASPLQTELFDNAPCGMALLDSDGNVSWVNHALGEMVGIPSKDLLGQCVSNLPDMASRALFTEHDLIQLHDSSGSERWLQRKRQIEQGESLLVFHDVTEQQRLSTENERLRRQVAELKLTDDLTGLPNKRAISQALDLQISRSRRYQNPLSLVMVHVALDDDQIEILNGGADPLLLGVSRFLRDRLRWVDHIGRWEDNIFILVLPETELADAQGLVEKIIAEQDSMQLPKPFEKLKPTLSFGLGRWKKGDDMRTLMQQVIADLKD